MSGHPRGIQRAVQIVVPGGKVALLGLPAQSVELDLAEQVVMKGVTLKGITGRHLFATWQQVTGILQREEIDFSALITHRYSLTDFAAAFAQLKSGRCGKVVLNIGEEG